MKLFTLPSTLAIASLFYHSVSATITVEDLPSEVRIGSTQIVKWTTDRNYQFNNFQLMHWDPSLSSEKPVRGEIVDHYINYTAGTFSQEWKVPQVKNGVYDLWISASEINQTWIEPNPSYFVNSNQFRVTGAPTLYPKEIAGVVVGTLAALVLLIGAFALAARFLRKRKSLAVNLSDDREGGYRDSVAGERG